MNGVVAQYWSIIPGGIHQVLHEPITGVDSFDVFGIEECSSADWNAESGVNTLNMSQHCLVMNANSKQQKHLTHNSSGLFFMGFIAPK